MIQILDKLSILFAVFFSCGKISCKTFNSTFKGNRARLKQLEDEAFYQLEVEDSLGYYYESDEVYYKRRSNI